MRGRWWGLAVLLAATSLAVSADSTSRTSSTSDSVTIPLILRQPGSKPADKKPAPPKKEEPKSPQDIVEAPAPTPVAMQSTDVAPNVPLLEPPPAPTLDPTLPTAPELFVPDLMDPLPPPKVAMSQSKAEPAASKQQPKPKLTPALPSTFLPAEQKLPPPMPREKPRSAVMQPVEDVTPATLRKAKLRPATPEEEIAMPRAAEMQPVEDAKPSLLRATPDGKPPSFRCRVRDVTAFHDRTQVRCHNKVEGKVGNFAVDTNQPVAETVVTKALAAMKTGKPITVTFAPESDLNPSNCAPNDCRRLIDIEN
jgi:hypothetical protein